MKTKDLVEGLLYLNPSLEIFFKAANIIAKDRNWKPVQHNEIGFIHKFVNPKFLIVVETQIHVYLFGDAYIDEYGKSKGFHVYTIDGFNCKHTAFDCKKLLDEIRRTVRSERFLPEGYMYRIIYMDNNNVYIFNKIDGKNNLFGKAPWSIGTNMYDIEVPTYETTADNIIKECYKHIEECNNLPI